MLAISRELVGSGSTPIGVQKVPTPTPKQLISQSVEGTVRVGPLWTPIYIMEAIFGIPGVVAAPIYYAYLKNELSAQNLI